MFYALILITVMIGLWNKPNLGLPEGLPKIVFYLNTET